MTPVARPDTLTASMNQTGRRNPVPPRTYEITFAGQASTTLRAEFDDCEVAVGPGTTTLRAELPDQAALGGLLPRIIGLRLELVNVLRVRPPVRL
jgi:hypothetical protein